MEQTIKLDTDSHEATLTAEYDDLRIIISVPNNSEDGWDQSTSSIIIDAEDHSNLKNLRRLAKMINNLCDEVEV